MPIFHRIFCAVAAVANLAPALAHAQEAFKAQGIVSPGQCAGADLFRTTAGEVFEVDVTRSQLRQGEPLLVEGRVFRRYSICRQYPWLEVTRASTAPARTVQPDSGNGNTGDEVVTISVHVSELPAVLPVLLGLRKRGSARRVVLQVAERSEMSQLTQFMALVAGRAPEAFENVELRIGAFAVPNFSWNTGQKVYQFNSILELGHALAVQ